MRNVGTVVRGIRTPIIKEGDDLANIVVDSLLKAKESEKFEFHNRDVVAITEAVVGISEGNYVSVDDILKIPTPKERKKMGAMKVHTFDFDGKSEISISGLGFIGLTGRGKVAVVTYENILVSMREPII